MHWKSKQEHNQARYSGTPGGDEAEHKSWLNRFTQKKSVVVKAHIEVDVYFPAAFIYYLNNVQNLLEDVSWEVQEWTPSY